MNQKSMRRLLQLLQSRIVFTGDVLYFTFKKHVFTGQIAQGGLIWHCTWQKPGEAAQPVFESNANRSYDAQQQPFVRTFESLTDWTETCIQECLDEYHTRYSSWKRVRHQRSDQPMEVLFKLLQRRQMANNSATADSGRNVLLYEQIASQKKHIEQLSDSNEKWKTWFETNFPNKPLPVDLCPSVSTSQPSEPDTTPTAQPFVLTSETGQYMVLHRLNEVAPQECVSWLKQNGQDSFKTMLKDIKQPVIFEPSTRGTDTWTPVDKETTKRFVHAFFHSC